jgi:hypothetical protein
MDLIDGVAKCEGFGLPEENEGFFVKKRCLVLLFLLISSSAVSLGNADAGNERWKAITGKTGDDRILYDPDSVIPLRPGVFRVRIMDFDKNHSPRRSLEEFDCSNKIVRDVEVIVERPNKPVSHNMTPSDWRGIVMESPRGELFKILCR